MKAITVREPWASCIASGAKTIENRASGTNYRGPLLVHTSQQIDTPAIFDPRVQKALNLRQGSVSHFDHGMVIAVADLVDVHDADTIPTLTGEPGTCCEPWGQRMHGVRVAKHLVLANVRRLAKPVSARGALGLWTPDEHVVGQVRHELSEAVAW
ncbi:hypothetical protein GCM10011608_09380 [Micromonospora sonchi]|uniref:ASCH domain-containing protein n=1 Tax=Micromonospora sonchi TaxID=1763543 RepID=A0A917WT67_9ACTN|nr:ASCH domain-containing protein [Micromonospora sonchi]GGM26651.1 hypothetical protein GCM10011608_09380 [Micromonospora sonchi]